MGKSFFQKYLLFPLTFCALSAAVGAVFVYFNVPVSLLFLLVPLIFWSMLSYPLAVTLVMAAWLLGTAVSVVWFSSAPLEISLLNLSAAAASFLVVLLIFHFYLACRWKKEAETAEFNRAVASYAVNLELWMKPDGSLAYVSPSSRRLLGQAPEDFQRTPALFFELIHPQDRQRVKEVLLSEFAKEKDPVRMVYRCQLPDRRERWLDCTLTQVYGPQGQYLGKRATIQDITTQRTTEDALRTHAERYMHAVESSEDGVWDMNLVAGRILFNPRYASVLGINPKRPELSLPEFYSLIHPEDLPARQTAFKQYALGQQAAFRAEYRLRTPEGGWEWVLERGKIIQRTADGKPLRAAGTHTNITDRKKIEAELQQSDTKFRQLTENMREIFWLRDRKTRQFLYASPSFADVWGQSLESLYQNPNVFVESVHWEDLGRVYQSQRQLFDTGEIQNEEFRVTHPDGSVRWVWLRAYPIYDSAGEFYRIAGMAEDITDRKRVDIELKDSEKRYRDLIENQGGGVSIIDPNDRFVYANPAGEDIFGVPRGTLAGRNFRDFLDDEQLVSLKSQSGLRRQGIESSYEISITRPDQEKRSLLITATPRFDMNNQFLGTIAIFRDHTQRKENEERLLYASQHDALTGINNRKYFEDETLRLDQDLYLPVSVVMVDVDGLKPINDRLGHAAGDELLKQVGEILKSSTRSNDTVCRIGGDEFALLLPVTDHKALQQVLNRVFQNVALRNQAPSSRKFAISLSAGGAVCAQTGQLKDAIKEADSLMYQAKEKKKNRDYIDLPISGQSNPGK